MNGLTSKEPRGTNTSSSVRYSNPFAVSHAVEHQAALTPIAEMVKHLSDESACQADEAVSPMEEMLPAMKREAARLALGDAQRHVWRQAALCGHAAEQKLHEMLRRRAGMVDGDTAACKRDDASCQA
jgi:hypothetical protein